MYAAYRNNNIINGEGIFMGQPFKRNLGQILLDGGFLSNQELDKALNEQKQTKELLGQVLVKMGVLKASEIEVPLVIQHHLNTIDDAIKIAAGERMLLGELLVRAGTISDKQLDDAIKEQKKSGEKLGEVLVRLNLLSDQQLNALLDFQSNQTIYTTSPLRLGELLVSTGHLSRSNLDFALKKQSLSRKKLGEILVEEGFVTDSHITYGMQMQKMLLNSVLAAILSLSMSVPALASDVTHQLGASTDPANKTVINEVQFHKNDIPHFVANPAPNNVLPSDITVTTNNSDLAPPAVLDFRMTSTPNSLTVAVKAFRAKGDNRVTGYLITESSVKPSASAPGWTTSVQTPYGWTTPIPTSFTFSGAGYKTAYAWARDANGNISSVKSSSVTISYAGHSASKVNTATMSTAFGEHDS
jgi:hypothetical protein